jgi:hypothetical protein
MRYICAQPATIYYSWQVDTMIYSFINNGVNQQQIDIIFAETGLEDNPCYYLLEKYPQVNFYFYPDTRIGVKYISSIRPHILKKHFYRKPNLYKGTFIYHDCDIVLTKPLNISHNYLCGCNKTCYLSNTISYIGYDYIKSKGEDVLDLMCKVVDISKEIIKKNQKKSGGAQYILKNIDYKFWEEVEIDCENLFTEVVQLNTKKKEENNLYHELQIWCADMWAVLWNLWKRNIDTEIIEELNFTWATEPIDAWGKNAIFHNAGINNNDNNEFYKANYLGKKPPKNLKINPNLASYKYYELVKKILNN